MAKGDTNVSNQLSNTTSLQRNVSGMQNSFWDSYNKSMPQANTDYNSIMVGYRNFMPNIPTTGTGASTGSYDRQLTSNTPYSGNVDQGGLANYFKQYGQSNGGDPSAVNDPNYWAGIALEKIGKGADLQETLNYLTGRISGGSGGTGMSGMFGGGYNPSAYGGFQNFANGGGNISFDPEYRAALGRAIGGYDSFASDGGFSPQAIQDIRARAIAPTRAVYQNAQRNVDRQRSLSGFSPNYTSATSRMARDLSSQISDANVNADASIAQIIQQGKMFGVSGLEHAGLGGGGLQSNIDQFNRSLQMQGLSGMNDIDQFGANYGLAVGNQQLNALNGMQNLYSSTPGMANMFANNALQASGQNNQLGLGMLNASISNKGPSTLSRIMNMAGSAAGTYGTMANSGLLGNGAQNAFRGTSALAGGTAAAAPLSIGAVSSTVPAGIGIPATLGGSASVAAPSALSGATAAGASGSAGGALGSAAAYGSALPALAAPLIAYGLNQGGSSLLDWGERKWGAPRTIDPYSASSQRDSEELQQLINTYGPNDPQVMIYMQQHPWASV